MSISYDLFTNAFLSKITEYEFLQLSEENRTEMVDGYLKRAISEFKKVCKYDLAGTCDDDLREFSVDVNDGDIDELVNVVSEGMVVQWLKPYTYRQELYENALSNRDYQTYSPAELLMRVGNAYAKSQSDFTQMVREYSYNHGDLTSLHI